jgi:hypothetical protein
VEAGIIKTGTPICVPSKDFIYIGICTGIQHNNKVIQCLTISVPNYYCTFVIWVWKGKTVFISCLAILEKLAAHCL